MKLFPLLLIGLAPAPFAQDPKPPVPEEVVEDAVQDAADKIDEATEALDGALDEATSELQDAVEETAQDVEDAVPLDAAEDALEQEAQEATEEVRELIDTQEVDPNEFAAQPGLDDSVEMSGVMLQDGDLETAAGEDIYFDDSNVEIVEVPGNTHAPIGVPLTQQVGEDQFGMVLRLSHTSYDGLRDSRDDISSADAFARGYTVAPTERTDQRYELEAYYGIDERWDVYAVLPFDSHDLDYDNSLGGSDSVDSSGLGDIQLGGVFRSYDVDGTRLSYLAGISIPTGSTDESGNYAGDPNARLPYDLQLGSGIFELRPGVLYETNFDEIQFGARAAGRIHIETENDEGWFPSNSMRLDVWAGKKFNDELGGTVRLQGDWWGDLHNFDAQLDPTQSPGEDSLRQGGSRINLYGGLSYDLDDKRTNRLQVELGIPVEEWLDGPQLSQELSFMLGWRVNF